jgi:hypothetical protein
MATWTVKELAAPVFITNSATAFITNATGHTTKVENIHLHNTDASARTVTIWRAPNNGGSVRTVAANDAYQREVIVVNAADSVQLAGLGWILTANNDTIQALADTTNKVSVCADGIDIV